VGLNHGLAPEGLVGKQSPEPGTALTPSSRVMLDAFKVPPLEGLTVDGLRKRFDGVKVDLRLPERALGSLPIVSIAPPPGTPLKKGDEVLVLPASVPELVGLTPATALKHLAKLGMEGQVNRKSGRVIAQEPAAGTVLTEGRPVVTLEAKA